MWTSYFFLLVCCSGLGFGSSNRCDEVRKVFQLRQIGPNQLLPASPRPGMLELSLLTDHWAMLLSDLLGCFPQLNSHKPASTNRCGGPIIMKEISVFDHLHMFFFSCIATKDLTCRPLTERNMSEVTQHNITFPL